MTKLAPSIDESVYHGGVWPTEAQQLLLRAALLDGPAATEAWVRWKEVAEMEAMDGGSWRLIPLVYVNLKRLGVDDPILLQARAWHLYQWSWNQKIFQRALGFLEELERLKIPAVVLKGVALANLYYPDTGTRPMADLDVLVSAEHFMKLGKKLSGEGWSATDGHAFDSFDMDALPSFGFMEATGGFCVDIHHHVLHENCKAGADDAFWAHAKPWRLRGRAALALAPEDQMIHVISHGLRWCDVPGFRWIADAWWILERSRGKFNYDRFCRQVEFHNVGIPILEGLRLMDHITPLDLPKEVWSRLEAMPSPVGARVRFIARTNPLPRNFLPRAARIWDLLRDEDLGYRITGESRQRRRYHKWSFGLIPSLLLFGIKILIRDRRQLPIHLALGGWRSSYSSERGIAADEPEELD